MGNFFSLQGIKVGYENYYVSKRIAGDELLEENLRYYEEKESEKLKILLLGCSDSGKSTLLRQFRRIHGEPYTDDELVVFVSTIHQNLLASMQILLNQSKILHISNKIIVQENINKIELYTGNSSFLSTSTLMAINELWNDPLIKSVFWNLKEEFVIDQNCHFLLDRCTEIAAAGYIPTSSDILYCSSPTLGIIRKQCEVAGTMFEMHEVGFKRHLKSRWTQFFAGSEAIIFVVDLTDYDRVVPDDKKGKNKMADTIEYFSSIVNNPCIGNASIILLFNKIDIFEKKYIKKKIKDVKCFQNYRGSSMSYFDGVTYFLNLFINQVNNSIKENGKIHHFVTNLLDTEITNHVINRCKQYILCDKDIHLDGYKTSTRSIRVDTLHSQTFSFSRNSKSASLFTHMNRDKLTHSVDLLTDTHSISSQKYVSEFSHVAMEENIRNKITKNSRNYYDDNED